MKTTLCLWALLPTFASGIPLCEAQDRPSEEPSKIEQLLKFDAGGATPFFWTSNGWTDHEALLLPVQMGDTYVNGFMQLDLGSATTFFYKETLNSLEEHYAKLTSLPTGFPVLEGFGEEIDTSAQSDPVIVGTMGSDLLLSNPILLDFKNHKLRLIKDSTDLESAPKRHSFSFRQGRILLPASIGQDSTYLMYDSGTSAFGLFTNEARWKELKTPSSLVHFIKADSWGMPIGIHLSESNAQINMAGVLLTISTIAYTEDMPEQQAAGIKASGLGGMIGNQLFIGKKLFLDCKNQEFFID